MRHLLAAVLLASTPIALAAQDASQAAPAPEGFGTPFKARPYGSGPIKVGPARGTVVVVGGGSMGPEIFKAFIDAESFMLVRTTITINVPQLGGPIEQVVDFSDFRDVDGIRVPYVSKSTNPIQTVTATITGVKQNVEIDDGAFVKPAGQ